MFNVLKIKYKETGNKVQIRKGRKVSYEPEVEVYFEKVGTARNMTEAKEKFGGHPFLSK